MSDYDLTPLSELPPDRAAAKLRAVGEFEAAASVLAASAPADDGGVATFSFSFGSLVGLEKNAWALPVDVFGYIAPGIKDGLTEIVDISRVRPQADLRGARINITLQRLFTASMPGSGKHTIVFDFATENALGNAKEEAHYNVSTTALDGAFADITNFAMFDGLTVDENDGISIHWRLINVKSEGDEELLGFLHSDPVQAGLKLITAAQPALGLLSLAADGIAKYLNARDTNAIVQDHRLGLNLSDNAAGGGLACGSYVAVQVAQADWQDWSHWAYDGRNGTIVRRGGDPIPYNYLIFGIDRHHAA